MCAERKIYVPPGGPPSGNPKLAEIYAKMGEDNIFHMLKDFYLLLGRSSIAGMFPRDLEKASEKSAEFFVFIFGGPPLYQQRHGPPMMRQRHLPFKINEEARQVWLSCFKEVLVDADKKYQFPIQYIDPFYQFLESFSAWMVNTEG